MDTAAIRHDIQVSLESVLLQVSDHVGVFYRGDAERDAFSIPLIAAAVEAGCGVIYVCDRNTPDQVAAQLADAGVDVEGCMARGQLQIAESAEVYLAGGSFDPRETVRFYQRATRNCAQRGYPVTCVIGEMCWCLRGLPGSERLLEYEGLYELEFDSAPAISLCLYDLDQTSGEHIFDLLRLHKRVVLNGIEMQNPCPDLDLLLGHLPAHGGTCDG